MSVGYSQWGFTNVKIEVGILNYVRSRHGIPLVHITDDDDVRDMCAFMRSCHGLPVDMDTAKPYAVHRIAAVHH